MTSNAQKIANEVLDIQGTQKSSTFEPAMDSIERAQLDGTVSLTIAYECKGGEDHGSFTIVISDVGGKFLMMSELRNLEYQLGKLDQNISRQAGDLDRMRNTERMDEQFDDSIAKLTNSLARNIDNFDRYEAGYKQALKAYTAYTGELWVPGARRADNAAKLKTAARADANTVLEALKGRYEGRKGGIQGAAARVANTVHPAAPPKKSLISRLFG